MQRHILCLLNALAPALHLVGLDAHIVSDTSGEPFYALEKRRSSPGEAEYWGLGLHIVVSSIDVPRRARC